MPRDRFRSMRKWVICTLLVALLFTLYQNRYRLAQQEAQRSSGLSDSFSGKYLSSRFAEHGKDPEKAAHYLALALKKDPNNIELIERTFLLHIVAGRMDEAIVIANRFHNLSPHAFAPNNMLALAEMRKGNFAGADQYLQGIVAGNSEDEVKMHALLLPIIRGWVLVGEGRYPDARTLLDNMDVRSDLLPFILYQRALMADVAGVEKDASRIYETLLKSTVKPSYHLTQAAANFYERIGRKDRAQELVQTFNEQHPNLPVSVPKAPPIASATEGLAEFFMETGSLLYGRRMEETALVYLNFALYLRPDLSYAQFLMASAQENRGAYAESIRYFRKLNTGDPFYDEAQVAIARNLYRSGEKEKAKKFLEARLRVKENDLDALSLLADFAVQEKDFKEAADRYTQLLDTADPKSPERWAWYFARGISLERLKKWDKAEPDFHKALELQPDHPEVLNYLAYSWIIRGINFVKARDMLVTALEARPNEAHILDSYGWALFALKQYEEALPNLERANELMPADPTVNDHLGDTYWMLGREREAKFQWERALSFDPEPEDAEAIKQKLQDGIKPSKD